MWQWIAENGGTIGVGALLAAAVIGIVVSRIRSRRGGGSSCGCGCADCALHGMCHRQ